MEAVEVEARFDTHGRVTPLKFVWEGRTYLVDSTGRRWEDAQGQHLLVMIPGGQVFELLFAPLERRWYLRRTGEGRALA